MKQVSLAKVLVDNVTMDESLNILEQFVASKTPHLIVTPNPEMIVSAQIDYELMRIINGADLKLPDGISMVVVSRLLGNGLKERVSGIDFLVAACKLASEKGWKLFLLGGATGVAEKAAINLTKKFPGLKVVGTHDGYFNNDSLIGTMINESHADILFAGLGAGKQEKWLYHNLKVLGSVVGVGIGGSFDVLAGVKKRAPQWVQKLYVEWLYRLLSEPQRWKRQLALPKFLWLTLIKYR